MILISFNTTGLSRFQTAQPSFTRIFREKYSAAGQFLFLVRFHPGEPDEKTRLKLARDFRLCNHRCELRVVNEPVRSMAAAAGWYEYFCEYFVKENDKKHCPRKIGMRKIVRLHRVLESSRRRRE